MRPKPPGKNIVPLLWFMGSGLLVVATAWWLHQEKLLFESCFESSGRSLGYPTCKASKQAFLQHLWLPKLGFGLVLATCCGIWLYFPAKALLGNPGKLLLLFPCVQFGFELACTGVNSIHPQAVAPYPGLFLLKSQWLAFSLILSLGFAGFWISRLLFKRQKAPF